MNLNFIPVIRSNEPKTNTKTDQKPLFKILERKLMLCLMTHILIHFEHTVKDHSAKKSEVTVTNSWATLSAVAFICTIQ